MGNWPGQCCSECFVNSRSSWRIELTVNPVNKMRQGTSFLGGRLPYKRAPYTPPERSSRCQADPREAPPVMRPVSSMLAFGNRANRPRPMTIGRGEVPHPWLSATEEHRRCQSLPQSLQDYERSPAENFGPSFHLLRGESVSQRRQETLQSDRGAILIYLI